MYMNISKRRKKQIIIITAIIIFIIVGFIINDRIMDFISKPAEIRQWIRDTGIRGVLCFACMNMVQVFLAVVPGGPFTVTAGYVFGPIGGTALSVISCTIAGTIVFSLAKKFGRDLVSVFVSEKNMKLLDNYDKSVEQSKKIERLMMLVFIIPGTPKDPLNYMAGLTHIPIWMWFFVNLIGRIPGAFIAALGGSAFGNGKYTALIAAIGGMIALVIIGRYMKSIVAEVNEGEQNG